MHNWCLRAVNAVIHVRRELQKHGSGGKRPLYLCVCVCVCVRVCVCAQPYLQPVPGAGGARARRMAEQSESAQWLREGLEDFVLETFLPQVCVCVCVCVYCTSSWEAVQGFEGLNCSAYHAQWCQRTPRCDWEGARVKRGRTCIVVMWASLQRKTCVCLCVCFTQIWMDLRARCTTALEHPDAFRPPVSNVT